MPTWNNNPHIRRVSIEEKLYYILGGTNRDNYNLVLQNCQVSKYKSKM